MPPNYPFTTQGTTWYNSIMTEGTTIIAANRSTPHSFHRRPWRLHVESLIRLSEGPTLIYELWFWVTSEPNDEGRTDRRNIGTHMHEIWPMLVSTTAAKAGHWLRCKSFSAVSSIAFYCPMCPAGGLVSRKEFSRADAHQKR